MAKDAVYHRSAIFYNEEFMKFAAEIAKKVEHPEIKEWCEGISKQHEFHLARHQKALKKLEDQASQTQDDDPTETPAPVDPAPSASPVESNPDPEQAADPVEAGVGTPRSIAEEQELFAREQAELDFHSTGEVVGRQEQSA